MIEFRADNITVLIDWIQRQHHKSITTYNFDAIPQVIVLYVNNTSAQLQVSYNTQYRVSITATLCGQSNATTTVTLHFSECLNAFLMLAS